MSFLLKIKYRNAVEFAKKVVLPLTQNTPGTESFMSLAGQSRPDMQFLHLTLPSFFENLALDEALLLEAEAGQRDELLRLWEWPAPAVVLGAAGIMTDDVWIEPCQADEVPLGRRSSGGGTVLLGRGCLLFSLILAYERAEELTLISSSYRYILSRLQSGLAPLVGDITLAGTSDLILNQRKFSGNSQQRKRHYLLHHGTLLYDFDLDVVGRYLRPPPRQPAYRQQRGHDAFLTNLPLPRHELEACLRSAWQADEVISAWPAAQVAALVRDKYAQPEWIGRR